MFAHFPSYLSFVWARLVCLSYAGLALKAMSNLSASPGSRSLELLKVAELRDELKKRGMSLKGVKKELFERLEEAVKKDEQDGIVHAEHGATLEGAHKTSISDGAEDSEKEDETLDETNDEASKTHNMPNARPSDNLLSSRSSDLLPSSSPSDVLESLSKTEEATPVSETHALSGVSAPDGVPGFNEDRELLSAASAASVGTNNDVLFVDNAVCENGDAMLLPPSAADLLEPGKETSGNHETRPEIASSDLKASENTDGEPESGFAVSDVINASIENNNAQVAVENVLNANNACGTDCAMHDAKKAILLADPLKENAEQLLKSESLIEVSPPETDLRQSALDSGLPDDKSHQERDLGDLKTEILSVASQNAYVPLAGSTYEELEKPVADERDMVVNEEKADVKRESIETDTGLEGKHELVIAGEMEKSDVKMEPMEVDAGLEDKHKLISEGNKEMQIDKEDPSQLKSPSNESQVKEVKFENSSCDYPGGSRVEESRVPDKCKSNTEDNTDLKRVEDDSQACINLRRKDPDTESKQQEPAKRMRRWNSANEVTVDALRPLTTDTVKEIILPESTDGSFVAAQRLTPKSVATSRELAPKVKVEPESGKTRTVPPSTRAPSNSLKIERFVRPFTLKSVKDLLGEFGQCVDFWMDQIKTHCFVTYSSVNEAVAARSGLYGRQWPPSVGHFLLAEFVDANEVKIRSEGTAEKAQAAQPTARLHNVNSFPTPPPRVAQSAPAFRSSSTTLPTSRFSRETQLPPVPKKDPEPTGLTLEDLFFKTKAKPSIYYLPLTDEQVGEKLAAAKKISKPPGSK